MTLTRSFFLSVILTLVCALSGPVSGQETPSGAQIWETQARALNGSTLLAHDTKIMLWGVENIEGMGAPFKLSARTTLDNVINAQKIQCTVQTRTDTHVLAQCTNTRDIDLGLYMLQKGFVVVNRASVYGTVYEAPYIQAETQAKNQKLGVWGEDSTSKDSSPLGENWVLIVSFVFFFCVVIAFAVLSFMMLRGFQKVTEAQKENMHMVGRERALKDKERELFAMMLDSEIKANKSKIQAYLTVYDEMQKSLRMPDRTPKYKKGGDILQAQPALERAVFDRNTDKMDILGDRLSSAVIHFYARIKTNPEYITLEPDMLLDDVLQIVAKAMKNATMLDKIADRLIELFSQGGHSSKGH